MIRKSAIVLSRVYYHSFPAASIHRNYSMQLLGGTNCNCTRQASLIKRHLSGKKYEDEMPVDDHSWVSEHLKAQGMKVKDAPDKGMLHVLDQDAINNPPEKIKLLVSEVLKLNIIEVNQLLMVMKDRLNIPDSLYYRNLAGNRGAGRGGGGNAGADPAAPAKAAEPEPVKEKLVFDIKIGAVDAKAKIKIIKEVRTITGLGLKEAKELVEKAPCVIKQGVKKEEVEAIKKVLTEAGAVVELL